MMRPEDVDVVALMAFMRRAPRSGMLAGGGAEETAAAQPVQTGAGAVPDGAGPAQDTPQMRRARELLGMGLQFAEGLCAVRLTNAERESLQVAA